MPQAKIEGKRWLVGNLEKSHPLTVTWKDPEVDKKDILAESRDCAMGYACGNYKTRLIPAGSEVWYIAGSQELAPLASMVVYCLKCYSRLPDRLRLLRKTLNDWERETITVISGYPLDTSL